jgi:hypothetical protein
MPRAGHRKVSDARLRWTMALQFEWHSVQVHPPSPPQLEHPPAPCSPAGSATPKARRKVSGFGESPSAVEMRSHDQPAARASCTALVSALWARWRAFTALCINSSTGAVMPRSMTRHLPQVEDARVAGRSGAVGSEDRLAPYFARAGLRRHVHAS